MKTVRAIYISLIICVLVLFIVSPDPCKSGIISGLLICGNVIIPSLFPFTVGVLLLLRCNVTGYLTPLSKIAGFIFNQNIVMFGTMLLSFIGGYPIGGRLIREMCEQGRITKHNARIMLCYCVNGGPAFIVLAVGNGMLHSKNAGIVLLISHITASLLLAIICGRLFEKEKATKALIKRSGFIDAFVGAVADASNSILGICAYVILFSAINNYIILFAQKCRLIKSLLYITEITTAIVNTDSIYIISALLGFGGLSIWCQVISEVKKVGVKVDLMIMARFAHAILSCVFTAVIIHIFPITLSTFSNLRNFDRNYFFSTPSLSISMIIMIILLIISIFSKNRGGNLLSDIV